MLYHVLLYGGQLCLSRLQPRIRTHQPADALRVSRHVVDFGHVDADRRVIVFLRTFKRHFAILPDSDWPPPSAYEVCDFPKASSLAFCNADRFPVHQRTKADRTRRFLRLPE